MITTWILLSLLFYAPFASGTLARRNGEVQQHANLKLATGIVVSLLAGFLGASALHRTHSDDGNPRSQIFVPERAASPPINAPETKVSQTGTPAPKPASTKMQDRIQQGADPQLQNIQEQQGLPGRRLTTMSGIDGHLQEANLSEAQEAVLRQIIELHRSKQWQKLEALAAEQIHGLVDMDRRSVANYEALLMWSLAMAQIERGLPRKAYSLINAARNVGSKNGGPLAFHVRLTLDFNFAAMLSNQQYEPPSIFLRQVITKNSKAIESDLFALERNRALHARLTRSSEEEREAVELAVRHLRNAFDGQTDEGQLRELTKSLVDGMPVN